MMNESRQCQEEEIWWRNTLFSQEHYRTLRKLSNDFKLFGYEVFSRVLFFIEISSYRNDYKHSESVI